MRTCYFMIYRGIFLVVALLGISGCAGNRSKNDFAADGWIVSIPLTHDGKCLKQDSAVRIKIACIETAAIVGREEAERNNSFDLNHSAMYFYGQVFYVFISGANNVYTLEPVSPDAAQLSAVKIPFSSGHVVLPGDLKSNATGVLLNNASFRGDKKNKVLDYPVILDMSGNVIPCKTNCE